MAAAKDVFQAALPRGPELRAAFLDEACGGDGELRREVDSLLAAHEAAGGFLSSPIGLDTDGAEEAGAPDAGPQRIGPYQILDTIAHGGMGTVYRAVRDDDAFRKTVALKLVRGGRHSDYFERRFRQERQILARLQHPNIATVLDGGTAEDGQPYLVMEYVEGQPITGFCAARGMGTRERRPCSVRCAAPSSTPIRTWWSTATSSPRTCWCTAAASRSCWTSASPSCSPPASIPTWRPPPPCSR